MDQDQRIDCSVGNQLGSHYGFAKRGWRTQDAFVMPQRLMYRICLIVTKIALKLHLNRLPGVTFVPNQKADAMLLQ
jgi:hypothetical protein